MKSRDMQIAEAVRDTCFDAWCGNPDWPTSIDASDLTAIIARVEAPAPHCWAVSGRATLFYGEFAESDAKGSAKRIGGTAKAFPLYTSQPLAEKSGEAINKRLLDALKDMCNAEEAMFNLTYGAWYSDCAMQDLPPIDQFVIKVRGTIAAAEKEVGK